MADRPASLLGGWLASLLWLVGRDSRRPDCFGWRALVDLFVGWTVQGPWANFAVHVIIAFDTLPAIL